MAGKLAVVFGGSGFVGRYVVRELARRGWRVRAAVRRPHLAQFLRPMGAVGQIQIAQANLRYPQSVEKAIEGADAVINLVGILFQEGVQNFDAVHVAGAAAVARHAAKAGVKTLIHQSAIGADARSDSHYARTKSQGEFAVRQEFPDATIIRPSIIFGPEDDFFNRFAAMLSLAPPFLPVPILFGGGKVRFQPVYVDDVADAICEAAEHGDVAGRVYELGGPRTYSLREILEMTLREIGKRRMLAPVPFALAAPMGLAGEMIGWLPFFTPPITRDQIELLKTDNIVGASGEKGALTLADLGIHPSTVESVLPAYMVRFRKYGQFAELPV